jgi:uncharacterized protein (DUF952 family)
VAGKIVLKITDRAAWDAACASGRFTGSADDIRDGFIHLSTPDQLQGTAEKYFRNQPQLVLVAFDAETLGAALRWEPSRDGALFPHYYGDLPTASALWCLPMTLDGQGIPVDPTRKSP